MKSRPLYFMMMMKKEETPSFETTGLSGSGMGISSSPLLIDDDDDDDDEQSYYDDDIDDGDDLFSTIDDTKIPTLTTSTGEETMMMKDDDDDDSNDVQQHSSAAVSPLDQILASEMNKLSVEERTQALEDVHGVSESFELDPSTIQCKLNELDLLINNNKTKEYKLAESLSSNYVQNADFRLQFLQADLFDVQAAAKRLFKFFHYKYKLFGKDLLVKDITLNDLNQQDLQLLHEGCLQIPLEKDRAGRPILLLFQHLATTKHHGSMLRVTYYVYMSLLRGTSASDGIRQKGLVCIFYNTHPSPNKVSPKLVWRALKLRQGLPIKTVACHACSLDKTRLVFRYLLNMWQKMTKSYLHARIRRHSGTDSECRAQLRAFGLPIDCFPIDDNGKMNWQYHQEWIRRRRMIEEEVEGVEGVDGFKAAATATALMPSSSSPAAATTTLAEENGENISSSSSSSCQHSPIMETSYSTDLLDTIGHDTDVFSLGSPLPLGSQFSQDGQTKMNSNRQAQFMSFNRPHHMAVDSNINTLPRRFSDTRPSPMHLMQSQCPLPTLSTPNMPSTPTLPAQQYPSSSFHHTILPVASMLSSSTTQRQESSSVSNYKLSETIALTPLSSPTSSPASNNNKIRRTSIASSSSHNNNDDGGGVILIPTPNDILFGRGKPMRNHPGNVKFRNLLELYHDKYNNAQKFEKGMIVKKLVQTLSETGSRFLKPTTTTTTTMMNEINNSNSKAAVTAAAIATGAGVGGWVIVDEKTAETKVSQYFRSRRPTKQSNKRK